MLLTFRSYSSLEPFSTDASILLIYVSSLFNASSFVCASNSESFFAFNFSKASICVFNACFAFNVSPFSLSNFRLTSSICLSYCTSIAFLLCSSDCSTSCIKRSSAFLIASSSFFAISSAEIPFFPLLAFLPFFPLLFFPPVAFIGDEALFSVFVALPFSSFTYADTFICSIFLFFKVLLKPSTKLFATELPVFFMSENPSFNVFVKFPVIAVAKPSLILLHENVTSPSTICASPFIALPAIFAASIITLNTPLVMLPNDFTSAIINCIKPRNTALSL